MSVASALGPAVPVSAPSMRGDPQAGEVIRCADKLAGAGFPTGMTKVTVISVDTTDRETPISGQEGICVQWR